jgi:FKBP-type peptidyl-prolyl cis-trans isomerase SlyD
MLEEDGTMNTPKLPNVVADDVVVSLDYTLTVNGEVVDSTDGVDPILFIQGRQNIIPGLESQLYGMKIGDAKKVRVPAKDAYGEIDPEAFVDVPRDEMPADIKAKPGLELTVRDEDGELMDAVIVSVSKDTVRLDFNHPLAGKDLEFEVTVLDLRDAEPEELEHGHVHEDDMEEEFDEDDEEYYEIEEDEDDEEEVEEDDDQDKLDGQKK